MIIKIFCKDSDTSKNITNYDYRFRLYFLFNQTKRHLNLLSSFVIISFYSHKQDLMLN